MSSRLTFSLIGTLLTEKIPSTGVVYKKFFLSGKTLRVHQLKFTLPFVVSNRLGLPKLFGINFFLG